MGARRGRFLRVGKQLASVDSWQIAPSLIFYRHRNEGTKVPRHTTTNVRFRKIVIQYRLIKARKPYQPRQRLPVCSSKRGPPCFGVTSAARGEL